MSTRDLSRFLVTRGFWLIVLEFTVIRVTTWFNVDYSYLANLQVIWTLGVSMVVLAALIHLPLGAIAAFGLAMVVLHNAFDGIRVASWQGPGSAVPDAMGKLWILLHQPAEFLPVFGDGSPVVFVIYPLVPWVGVIALGYVCGSLYTLDPGRRRVWLRADRSGAHRRVHRDPRHERVRRSAAVGAAEHDALLCVLLRQHDEVSGLAALPADDDRPCAAGAGRGSSRESHHAPSRSSRASAACRCSSISGSGRSRTGSRSC